MQIDWGALFPWWHLNIDHFGAGHVFENEIAFPHFHFHFNSVIEHSYEHVKIKMKIRLLKIPLNFYPNITYILQNYIFIFEFAWSF